MRRLILTLFTLVTLGLSLILISKANTALTQGVVEIPPVKIAVFLPDDRESNADLLPYLGNPTLSTSKPVELESFVAQEKPNAIVIHKSVLAQVDAEWLRNHYDQGVVIGGVNMTRTELKQYLGLPTSGSEVLPAFIKPPYMAYLYERGDEEQEGWLEKGSGLALLKEPNEFARFVEGVERASALNRHYREQAEE